MLENLTERARRTLFFARCGGARAGAPMIESERRLLLGMLREGDEPVEQLHGIGRLLVGDVIAHLATRVVDCSLVVTEQEGVCP
jgi:hypothetical protein